MTNFRHCNRLTGYRRLIFYAVKWDISGKWITITNKPIIQ
jgi:hypothetical protein